MSRSLPRHGHTGATRFAVVLLAIATQIILALHYPVHLTEDLPGAPEEPVVTVAAGHGAGSHHARHHHNHHHICPVCFVGDMLLKTMAAGPAVLALPAVAPERVETVFAAQAAQPAPRPFDAQGPPARA